MESPKQNIIQNFDEFCYFLIEKGVAVATVNAIRSEVNTYTSRGMDPKFEISEQGVRVEDKYFSFVGLGIAVTAAIAIGSTAMK